MTAKTNEPTTAYPSLAAALAAFQRALPTVEKGAKGQVRGNPNYKYADLADLNGVVLPELGSFGLSFSCKPTLNAGGRFVLAYTLRHESGGEDSGEYPLPDNVSPQDMGSAQSYARRYVLQAMTGVAPVGQDDDGAAATRAYSHRGAADQQPRNGSQGGQQGNGNGQRTNRLPADEPTPEPQDDGPNPDALAVIQAACKEHGWDKGKVAERYTAQFSEDIAQIKSVPRAKAFVKLLPDVFGVPATNGAAQ